MRHYVVDYIVQIAKSRYTIFSLMILYGSVVYSFYLTRWVRACFFFISCKMWSFYFFFSKHQTKINLCDFSLIAEKNAVQKCFVIVTQLMVTLCTGSVSHRLAFAMFSIRSLFALPHSLIARCNLYLFTFLL